MEGLQSSVCSFVKTVGGQTRDYLSSSADLPSSPGSLLGSAGPRPTLTQLLMRAHHGRQRACGVSALYPPEFPCLEGAGLSQDCVTDRWTKASILFLGKLWSSIQRKSLLMTLFQRVLDLGDVEKETCVALSLLNGTMGYSHPFTSPLKKRLLSLSIWLG